MITRAEIRAKAHAIRNKIIVPSAPFEPVKPPLLTDIGWKRIGRICPDGINSRWQFLLKTMRKMTLMARILASKDVPEDVYQQRMRICKSCPHVAEKTTGEHFCACCRCPAFSYASLEKKNRKSLHMCTASSPQFKEYK